MFRNSVFAKFNYFAANCIDYNWDYGLRELEALEAHIEDNPAIQKWHDVLVETFYSTHSQEEEAQDYVIIE